MNLITKQVESEVFWGDFIEPEPYCMKNYMCEHCKKDHDGAVQGQFTQCHHGMSIYKNDNAVYFSMREKETYRKGKQKQKQETQRVCYNPVLPKEKLLFIIEADAKNTILDKEEEQKNESIRSLRHEIKHLNAQIKDNSDLLIQTYGGAVDESITITNDDIKTILSKLRTIFVCSSMIMSRYALDDYEKNPEGLMRGAQIPCVVYKKFDKICKILRNYERKGIDICIEGNSYLKLNAFASFEFIPLLILENAIKYSWAKSSVKICFAEKTRDQRLLVTVTSYGPYCEPSELTRIFEKGYRGKNAQKKTDGSGIGLFFVKILCNLHKIKVWAETDDLNCTDVSGIKYSNVSVKLEFQDVFL